jgi:hypothetical protein
VILRRYGTTIQSVVTNFDSKAFTEIGFRREEQFASYDDFLSNYERVSEHALVAESEGNVQDEVESALLEDLLAQLGELNAGLGEREYLLVESEQGRDYPKTRTRQKNVVVDGENRLRFYATVDPPLAVAVFRARPSASV